MASNKKPGITCLAHGSSKPDRGTNCRGLSPAPGIDGTLLRYWTEAESGGKRLLNEIEILWARKFSATKATAFAVAHAKAHPMGLCARYSTAAIAAGFGVEENEIMPLLGTAGAASKYVKWLTNRLGLGGITTPNLAKDYGTQVLTLLGFSPEAVVPKEPQRTEIPEPGDYNYDPEAGDVIIFPANAVAGSEAGHMQICTGNSAPERLWVSDGHQKTILPNSSLALEWHKVGFVAYRFRLEKLLFKAITTHKK